MASGADTEDESDIEYSDWDNDEMDEQELAISNQYYKFKDMVKSKTESVHTKKKSKTESASPLSGFAEVAMMNSDKWGFRALKQTVKIYCRLGKYKEMMDAYREMLTYIKSAVRWYETEKAIDGITSLVNKTARQHFDLLQEFYQTTLNALDGSENRLLWFRTNLHFCNFLLNRGEYGRMSKILKKVHKSCQKKDGTDDQDKGTQLLEVYANQFLVYIETKDNENHKMQQLYQKALAIEPEIPVPKFMGIIRECGGKMHMAERQWAEAATDFFQAFKNYDENGSKRRIQCLKYLVLAKMMMGSDVSPFGNKTAKKYENDPEILAMTNLIAKYKQNEFTEFERILESNSKTIMDDPFIRTYMEDLLKKVRRPALQKLMEPYTEIGIPFVSKELNVPEKEVTECLMSLILDGQIDFTIDEMNNSLLKGDSANERKLYRD